MAFVFQERYEPHVEERMRAFAQMLSEKDRRRFAALEAVRLGHGGFEYIAEVLECSVRTIERGTHELDSRRAGTQRSRGRTRATSGGWSKKKIDTEPELEKNLKSILEVRTAGDPDEPDVLWTDLSSRQIAEAATALGIPARRDQSAGRTRLDGSAKAGATPDREDFGRWSKP